MNVICFSLVFLCYSLIPSLRIAARPIGSLFPADAVWDAVDSMSSHDGVVHCGHVTAVTSGAGEGRAARSPRDQHGSGVRDCQRQSGSERSGQCGVLLDPQIRVSAAHVTPSTLQLDDEIISYYSS